MFSIIKKHKVQVLYKIDTHTADILRLRRSTKIQELVESTTKKINQITSLTTTQETNKTINKFFPEKDSCESNGKLSELFQRFPHVFHDLIRVVSTYRTYHEGRWFVPEENESNIAEVFLFEKRPADIWVQIPWFIKTICKHQDFIKFTEKQHSLLDIWYFGISKMQSKERKKFIEKLIETSLAENIPSTKRQKLNFGAVREKICKYLSSIYGVDTSEFEGINDKATLAEKINKWLGNKSANMQKLAWKMLQALYSWWAIQEIEEQEKKFKDKNFQVALLEHIWGVFPWIRHENSEETDGTTLHHGTFNFKWKNIEVTWRIKSTESILMKTWEDEDYGYISSLRDRFWISLTFPDDMNSDDIAELMKLWSTLLSKNGYILKNKWLLSTEEMNQIQYESGKSPLLTSTKPGGDPNMQNASQSGFAGIKVWHSNIPIGTEIQYSRKSAMEWKKRENAIYKFRALFDGLLRGEYVDTPQSVYNSIKRKIPNTTTIQSLVDPDTTNNLNLNTHKDLMKYLMNKKIICPYYGQRNNKDIVLFSTNKHADNAMHEWDIKPVKIEYNPWNIYDKLLTHIDTLQ